MLDRLMDLDRSIFLLINHEWRTPVLNWIMPALSDWRYTWLPLGLIMLLVLRRRPKRTGWILAALILVAAIGDSLTTYILKPFFDRPRPFIDIRHIMVHKGSWGPAVWIKPHPTLSFPSTHAVNTTALAVLLGRYYPRWRIPAAILIILVCFSRVYLGVHYPADVLGGVCFGLAVAGFVIALESTVLQIWPNRLQFLKVEA